MRAALFAAAAYLYGALPYAYLATRLLAKRTLTEAGTGNVSVTNAFKVGGTAVGVIAIAGEITKALFPIVIGRVLFEGDLHITLALVYCAFLGTSFSVFLKGRGGKGTTMAVWSLCVLSPYACTVQLALWAVIVFLSKHSPRIKAIPLILLPLIFHIFERDLYFTAFCILLSLTIWINNRIRPDDYKYHRVFSSDTLPKAKAG